MNAYQRISRYKGVLMGIAILIVVYGHLFYYHSGLTEYQYLNVSQWYTVGSVDIFLFLSGFGIYHSLKKNGDPLAFAERRFSRLLPSYIPFIIIYCGFMLWAGQMNKWQALGNLTTFGWWTRMGAQFNWYIPTLIMLYLLSPLMFGVIEKYGRKSLFLIGLFILLDAACVDTSLMMGVSRFPVYFLGMYLGAEAAADKAPSKRHLILAGVMAVLSMVGFFFLVVYRPNWLSKYGFWWHPFLLSTPGCLYFTTWLLEKQDKWVVTRQLNRGLNFLGGKSFEIYLCHLLVYEAGLYFGVQGWVRWIILAVLGLLVGVGYAKLIEIMTSREEAA